MTEHEQTLELLPGYALGILSDGERTLVRRHLDACAACAQQANRLRSTTEALPEAIELGDPPPDLRARILAKAALSTAASRAWVRPGGDVSSPVDTPNGAAAPYTARRSSEHPIRTPTLSERLFGLFRGLSPVASLAGLALIVLLATGNLWLLARLRGLESAAALRTVALQGAQAGSDAVGTLVISLDGQHGTLVVDGLPPLNAEQQYQLWLIRDGMRTSGGVFSVSPEGYGALWIESLDPLAGYQAVGVTVEPYGGSTGPTGAKVLGGDL